MTREEHDTGNNMAAGDTHRSEPISGAVTDHTSLDWLSAGERQSGDFTLRLPNYEGPLDVLLRLIEERQLEITAVSVASVADQFLTYMTSMSSREPRMLSNFVSVAARLILLKSRALLPQFDHNDHPDEENGDDLVQQLRGYQLYKRTARWLQARETAGLRCYDVHPPTLVRPHSQRLPLDNVTLAILARAMHHVVDRWLPPPPVDNVLSRLPFTVHDFITRIEAALQQNPRITFHTMLGDLELRVEIIISLLAVLELLKRNSVVVRQEQLFGEIVIEKVEPIASEGGATETPQLDQEDMDWVGG